MITLRLRGQVEVGGDRPRPNDQGRIGRELFEIEKEARVNIGRARVLASRSGLEVIRCGADVGIDA